MSFRITDGKPADGPALAELLPRLASFPRPAHRSAEEVYAYDARVLARFSAGGAPELLVHVARDDEDDRIVGFAVVTMKPDLLNGSPLVPGLFS